MDPVHILMDPVHGPGPRRGSMFCTFPTISPKNKCLGSLSLAKSTLYSFKQVDKVYSDPLKVVMKFYGR